MTDAPGELHSDAPVRGDLRPPAPGDLDPPVPGPEAHDYEVDLDAEDAEVRPPVLGCLRCGARMAVGSRYCPNCGVPVARSGLQAASALSRTRRPARLVVRVVAPLLVLAVVAAVLWTAVLRDPMAGFRSDVGAQVERAVGADRALSRALDDLRPGDSGARALARATRSLATIRAADTALGALHVPDSGDDVAQRGRRAVVAVRLYVETAKSVLRRPTSAQISRLGPRSSDAVTALGAVEDLAPTVGATSGAHRLADYARARLDARNRK